MTYINDAIELKFTISDRNWRAYSVGLGTPFAGMVTSNNVTWFSAL